MSEHTKKGDALDTLGQLIDASFKRDAIHLAVVPCIAAHELGPGYDIGIINGEASVLAEKKLGIVDPFLKKRVQKR